MSRSQVSIAIPDCEARAVTFRPDEGSGPWPGAIILMDAPALRPALFEMGERLAAASYYVLLPDLFWLDIAAAPAGNAVALFDSALKNPRKWRGCAGRTPLLDLNSLPTSHIGRTGATLFQKHMCRSEAAA